jgi:hypothetical protein
MGVSGDEVRAARFGLGLLYSAGEVDDLLSRVAAELDAGRPTSELIRSAAFPGNFPPRNAYDVEAVDWFLEMLLARTGPGGAAGHAPDPWQAHPVANWIVRPGASRVTKPEGGIRAIRSASRSNAEHFYRPLAEECAAAWREFDDLPGARLTQGLRDGPLRDAGQRVLAARRGAGPGLTIRVGGREMAVRRVRYQRQISDPRLGEMAAGGYRDSRGQHQQNAVDPRPEERLSPSRSQRADRKTFKIARLFEVQDVTGTPVLYLTGRHYDLKARTRVTFPDGRSLRFPVRGTGIANAAMTAVDEAGRPVARYRSVARYRQLPGFLRELPGFDAKYEVAIHPDQALTDELLVAVALSARWLSGYFRRPAEGGG